MIFDFSTCNRLLGDKSPFSQQNLQGDALDRDEETARIQCKSLLFETIRNDLEINELDPNMVYDITLWRNLIHVANST